MNRPRNTSARLNAVHILWAAFLILQAVAPVTAEPADRSASEYGRPSNRWYQIETPRFRFLFQRETPDSGVPSSGVPTSGDDISRALSELLSMEERVFQNASGYLNWTPPEPVTVVLRSRTAEANGFYTSLPNHIELFVASPTGPWMGARSTSWLEIVFTHELIHYMHLARPVGFFGIPSRIFGPATMSANILFIPGWFIEGPTVTGETIHTDGGRGRNEFFEMTWSAPILEERMFSYNQASFGSSFAPSGRIYTAGYLFTDYLQDRYGKSVIVDLHRAYSRWPFFGMRRAVKTTTGERATDLFAAMVAEQEELYAPRRMIGQGQLIHPATPGNYYLPVATAAGLIGYRSTTDAVGALAEAAPPAGGALPWQNALPLRPSDPWSWSITADGATIAYTQVEADLANSDGYTTWSNLFLLDRATGKRTRLSVRNRYYHPAISPDGSRVVVVERQGSYSRLVEILLDSSDALSGGKIDDRTTGKIRTIYAPDAVSLFTPRFSRTNEQMVLVQNDHGRQELVLIEWPPGVLPTADSPSVRVIHLFDPEAAVWFPRFSAGGDGTPETIIFGSDAADELALYEYDLNAKTLTRILRDTVAAYEGERTSDGIRYAGYSSDGYVVRMAPAQLILSEPVALPGNPAGAVGSDAPGSPLPGAVGPVTQSALPPRAVGRRYFDFPRPGLWLPTAGIGGTGDSTELAFGMYTVLVSNLGNNSISGSLLWDTTENAPIADLAFTHRAGATDFSLVYQEEAKNRLVRADIRRPLWYREDRGSYRYLVAQAGAGYEEPADVFSWIGATARNAAYAPPRAFFGGRSTVISASTIPGSLSLISAGHAQPLGFGAQLLEAGLSAAVRPEGTIGTILTHRATENWNAGAAEEAVLLSLDWKIPLALLDWGHRGMAILGAGINPYAEQIVPFDHETFVAGVEIAADIQLWNLPLRLTGGAAYRFAGETYWYFRVTPPGIPNVGTIRS